MELVDPALRHRPARHPLEERLRGADAGLGYRVGSLFAARIDNVDPGAIIGRGSAPTREQAKSIALEKALLSLDLEQAGQALRRSVDHLNSDRPVPRSRRFR